MNKRKETRKCPGTSKKSSISASGVSVKCCIKYKSSLLVVPLSKR